MTTSITLAKVVLAAALSMAGYEQPQQKVAELSDDKAEAIMATLLSDSSRKRFEQILDDARVNGVVGADDLGPEEQATLSDIANEAGTSISQSKPLF